MEFLSSGVEVRTKIESLISGQSSELPICIAVAFWGAGSEKLIQSDERRSFRIICNLDSGGTNPHTIEIIRRCPNVVIKHLRTLHAKVVISQNGAVVSSANFSANGLMFDALGHKGWDEAGLFTSNAESLMENVQNWFDGLWGSASRLSEADLILAKENWLTSEGLSFPAPTTPATLDAQGLRSYRTVHFVGRIKPRQRNLRSAAAIMALSGHTGEWMPLRVFEFLFSGGRSRKAYENHREKFEISDGFVRLKSSFIGYFVGENGSLAESTDAKRRKGFEPRLIDAVAQWMRSQGQRPMELEGEAETASFAEIKSKPSSGK